jgi:hypothetical protein
MFCLAVQPVINLGHKLSVYSVILDTESLQIMEIVVIYNLIDIRLELSAGVAKLLSQDVRHVL